ncbi:MAG TPA: hypothetical protein VD996_14090, partial [Chitinophagaceae bacterium]|nr:hypothetical protein [Chitinophagaceae bacterium]
FSPTVEADIDRNFNDFLQRYAAHNVRIFACNITHLQHLPFGTHASGLQFIDDSLFFPEGSGLTQLGKNIVRKLHDNNILVDVKHMAYSTRIALYAERDIRGYTQPIICTHAGIAGCSWNERFKYLRTAPQLVIAPSARNPQQLVRAWQVEHLKKKGHVKPPNSSNAMSAFNLSSINLYDEDIMQIFRSEGLIGISLDQRIVGYPGESIGHTIDIFPSDVEYIADADAQIFFGTQNPQNLPVFNGNQDEVLKGSEAEDHNMLTVDSHARYFLNQVVHILAVAKKNGHLQKALTQICIGSDFDGLINPIDCCETAESFTAFRQQLSDIMKETNFWDGTGIKKTEIDVDQLLGNLFFENAHQFLLRNFQ